MKIYRLLFAAITAAMFSACNAMDNAGDAPATSLCVISMEDAEGGPTTEFEGKTVSFCCENCMGRWEKMDDDGRRSALAALAAKR